MTYKAVDSHIMMEGSALRDEEIKFWTFVFQFLGLVRVKTVIAANAISNQEASINLRNPR